MGPSTPREGDLKREYHWKILGRRGSSFPTLEYQIPLRGKVEFNLSRIPKGAKFLNSELTEEEATSLAEQQIEDHHKNLLAEHVDLIESIDTEYDIKEIEFIHAPIWEVRYSYRERIYNLFIDAATGEEIKGEVPDIEIGVTKSGLFKSVKRMFGK